MNEIIQELRNIFEDMKKKDRITVPGSIEIIEDYFRALESYIADPSVKLGSKMNSLMVLRLLITSGDDMPYDSTDAASFQKQYRSWGVIYSRGIGSYDSIMWNLMHMDALIWKVLEKNGIK